MGLNVERVGGCLIFSEGSLYEFHPANRIWMKEGANHLDIYSDERKFWTVSNDNTDVPSSSSVRDLALKISDLIYQANGVQGYPIKKISFEYLNPQTNTAILTPTAGKRWVITDMVFSVDGVNNVTFFDETNTSGNQIIKVKSGNERFFNHAFSNGVPSAAVGNSLRVTSTNQADFRGTIIYYETY